MKKVILYFTLVCSSLYLQAQDENNTSNARNSKTSVWDHHATFGKPMWIGGSLGFQSVSDLSNAISIGPQWGLMLNNRIGAGVNVDYIHTFFDSDIVGQDSKNEWNIHPYARLYFAGTKNFKLYGDAFIEFGGGKATFNDGTADNKLSTFGVGVDLGAQFWFADDFSMACGIEGVSYKTTKPDDGDSQAIFTLGLNFTSLNYSLFYHF